MTTFRIGTLHLACLAAVFALSIEFEGKAQTSSPVSYLRIANLLPIQTPAIEIRRGADSFLAGIKAGFFQNYLPIPENGVNQFVVKQGEKVLGNFSIPRKGGAQFYTLAISQNMGESPAVAFQDDAPTAKPPLPGETTPPEIKPRIRVYAGGYDFPIKISAKGVGEWIENKKAVIAEGEINGNPPKIVQVTFVDKYNQTITLTYPTDYSSASCYSVFVSQRGIKRPRLQVFADNAGPADDPLAASDATPTPTPIP